MRLKRGPKFLALLLPRLKPVAVVGLAMYVVGLMFLAPGAILFRNPEGQVEHSLFWMGVAGCVCWGVLVLLMALLVLYFSIAWFKHQATISWKEAARE